MSLRSIYVKIIRFCFLITDIISQGGLLANGRKTYSRIIRKNTVLMENIYRLQSVKEVGIRAQIWNHMPLIVFLVLINTVMPWILMRLINRSFTARVEELSKAFDHVDADHLQEISYVRGKMK